MDAPLQAGTDALKALTVGKVATLLDISERAVYRLIAGGELESFHIGRSLRCTPQAVAAYIRGREAAERAEPAPELAQAAS